MATICVQSSGLGRVKGNGTAAVRCPLPGLLSVGLFVLTNCEYAVKFRCNHKQDEPMSERKQIKDYPDQTPGSKLAAKVRQKSNMLTDEQRGDSFKRGLAMIYGGAPAKKAVSARH